MNAQAIREETVRVSETLAQYSEARLIFRVLGEIAAQLAELNANGARFLDKLNEVSSGGQIDVKVWER